MAASSVVATYLMLVSFMTPVLIKPELSHIRMINQAPFQGVAAMVNGAYATKKIDDLQFAVTVRLLRLHCKKDVWPWVFLNRFIGYKKGDVCTPYVDGTPLGAKFESIKGMDLYNQVGALEDFYNSWKVALRLARKLKSPGIVFDGEAYNNYMTGDLTYLAHLMGRPVDEVRQRLEEIGAHLVDLADQIYPEATIWVLAMELGDRKEPFSVVGKLSGKRHFMSCSYIYLGMLERAKEKGSKLTFVSGGQEGLGYCHYSLETMEKKIRQRDNRFKPFLTSYKNLHLGGTIAPWDRPEAKTGYFLINKNCINSPLQNIDEFEPLVVKLFTHYRYNWIYAAWNPFDPKDTASYENMLRRALTSAAGQKRE